MDDDDDLVGEAPKTNQGIVFDAKILDGVTQTWLMKAFGEDHYSLRLKLKDCPKLSTGTAKKPMYDLAVAAAYLVKSTMSVEEQFKQIKVKDMPVVLQKDFWDAQLKRLKYEQEAKDLWRTESVMDVFAETFMMMRDSIRLWLNDIERNTLLSPDQKALIVQHCDTLQNNIYENLVTNAGQSSRGNAATEEVVPDV